MAGNVDVIVYRRQTTTKNIKKPEWRGGLCWDLMRTNASDHYNSSSAIIEACFTFECSNLSSIVYNSSHLHDLFSAISGRSTDPIKFAGPAGGTHNLSCDFFSGGHGVRDMLRGPDLHS